MAITGFKHKVRWNEFKEIRKSPAGIKGDAYIYANFRSNWRGANKDGKNIVSSVITTINVNRNKSWVVVGKKDYDLLKHEQGHYDITAIGARELNKEAIELSPSKNSTETGKKFNKLAKKIQTSINSINTKYDKETKHSTNVTQQANWLKKIKKVKANINGKLADL